VVALTQAPSVVWYFARAAGFVSLLLLASSVCVGIALSLRLRSPRFPMFLTEGLHRYLSTVLLVFVGIHVTTLLLDPFARFSLADMLVPFASRYRTLWMALGICAAELTLALGLSVYVRRWIGYKAWRLIHYGTYALFPLGLLHGIGTGTDTRSWWGLAIYAITGVSVMALVFWRAGLGSEDSPAGVQAEAKAKAKATASSVTPMRRTRSTPSRRGQWR
jgi:predicted ferric reductase